jgi:hypothetical protein
MKANLPYRTLVAQSPDCATSVRLFFFSLSFFFSPSVPSPPRLPQLMVHVPHGWLVLDLQPLGAEPHECGGEKRVAAPPLRSTICMRAH